MDSGADDDVLATIRRFEIKDEGRILVGYRFQPPWRFEFV